MSLGLADGEVAPRQPDLAARRLRGIFYSPEDIVSPMVDWAVRNDQDSLFDPSFGGCVFLRAAVERLRQRGASQPTRQIFGTDSEVEAQRDADQLVVDGAQPHQFLTADFLKCSPHDVGGPFTAVVGNPPYVRRRVLDAESLSAARAAIEISRFKLAGQASYWAYFVLHSLQFIDQGGRLALILPGAVLHADYARPVRDALRETFRSVTVVVIDGRLFPEAEEESVLVLADGCGEQCGQVRIGTARRRDLDLTSASLARSTRILTKSEASGSWLRGVVPQRALEVYDDLALRSTRLGSEAIVRIGAVTGANPFFVLTDQERIEFGIEDCCLRRVVARASQLRGLAFTESDTANDAADGRRVWLFTPPPHGPYPLGAEAYLRVGETLGVHEGHKCATRRPWYVAPDTSPPDAFLQYMAWYSPRLVLNEAGAACTNTVHAVKWRHTDQDRAQRIALAVLSTPGQLSAELEGRSCGGGVLKLEPSDARRLVVPPLPKGDLSDLSLRVDRLLREGETAAATAKIDGILSLQALSREALHDLRDAVILLRARRHTRHTRKAMI